MSIGSGEVGKRVAPSLPVIKMRVSLSSPTQESHQCIREHHKGEQVLFYSHKTKQPPGPMQAENIPLSRRFPFHKERPQQGWLKFMLDMHLAGEKTNHEQNLHTA